jgi:amino acid transporter
MMKVMNREVCGSAPAKVVKVIGFVVLGIIAVAVLAIVFGLFVKWLWNALMPELFGLPVIGYWQAVGIVVLSHILFGAGHGEHHHERRKRKKTIAPAEPQKSAYQLEMEQDYADFWREEGREAFRSWMSEGNGKAPE